MKNEMYEELGKVKLVGEKTEGIPMWGINHYFKQLCDNYVKLVMLVRMCTRSWDDADVKIVISRESVPISFDKQKIERFLFKNDDCLVFQEDIIGFWFHFQRCERPMVYQRTRQGELLPFYNYFQKEAIKITDVTYNSPISIGVQGIVDGIVDLAMAKPRYEMERAEHEARQISYLAQGYASIARAAQVVSDPRTPDGIKQYALGELNKLLIKQGKLNDQLGIIQEKIDRKI